MKLQGQLVLLTYAYTRSTILHPQSSLCFLLFYVYFTYAIVINKLITKLISTHLRSCQNKLANQINTVSSIYKISHINFLSFNFDIFQTRYSYEIFFSSKVALRNSHLLSLAHSIIIMSIIFSHQRVNSLQLLWNNTSLVHDIYLLSQIVANICVLEILRSDSFSIIRSHSLLWDWIFIVILEWFIELLYSHTWFVLLLVYIIYRLCTISYFNLL